MRLRIVLPALTALLLGACAHRSPLPTTDGPLELRRVVLYRNGIGYFERHGQLDDDVLRLKVRRDQVDDLLKSLTVIDRKSGQAVSVSMPLDPQSWVHASMALTPGEGNLAQVLDQMRGTAVSLHTTTGRVRGRLVMVEQIVNEPDPNDRVGARGLPGIQMEPQIDHKVTLVAGDQLRVVRLSDVNAVTLHDGDLALQLHRRLDASAGEGMFQQVEVDIRLAGSKSHDLVVSYVVSAPMWKPTYRVVLPEDGRGEALLQGWAVVDNTTGEDWNGVSMALTSGEPIAFEYDLHTPRTVPRTDLTEAGVRRRARVAMGETTYGELDEDAEEERPMMEAELDDGAFAQEADKAAESKKKARVVSTLDGRPAPSGAAGRAADASMPASEPAPAPAPDAPGIDYESLRRSTLASARSKQVSGMTRFDLTQPVTVPNGSSTMVAILNQPVAAEETFLYRPGGAGIGYEANPYRVVRFKNSTSFVLEPGPISIYAGGSFVGEGLSEAVGADTSATIPFAVEPSILVTSQSRHKGDEMQIVRIVRGVVEVESFNRIETTWHVKGRSKEGFRVLVRHAKAGGDYALEESPEGTEILPDAYLVPVAVGQGKTEGRATVVEQTPSRLTLTIWDSRMPALLDKLVASADVTPQMRKKLEPVVALRREIGRIDTEIEGLQRQQTELDRRAHETRQSLEAIKKDAAAAELRRKLGKRLEEFTSEADKLGRRIVELQSERLDKKIQLEDLLQDLDLRATSTKRPGEKT